MLQGQYFLKSRVLADPPCILLSRVWSTEHCKCTWSRALTIAVFVALDKSCLSGVSNLKSTRVFVALDKSCLRGAVVGTQLERLPSTRRALEVSGRRSTRAFCPQQLLL